LFIFSPYFKLFEVIIFHVIHAKNGKNHIKTKSSFMSKLSVLTTKAAEYQSKIAKIICPIFMYFFFAIHILKIFAIPYKIGNNHKETIAYFITSEKPVVSTYQNNIVFSISLLFAQSKKKL